MLVTRRRVNETIMLGDDVAVTVVDIRGDKVRLGITSPKEMPVHRREVYDAIHRPNQSELTDSLEPARRDPSAFQTRLIEVPLVRSATGAATITLSGLTLDRLDALRATSELSRDQAMETLLAVISRAHIASLCDLERQLAR